MAILYLLLSKDVKRYREVFLHETLFPRRMHLSGPHVCQKPCHTLCFKLTFLLRQNVPFLFHDYFKHLLSRTRRYTARCGNNRRTVSSYEILPVQAYITTISLGSFVQFMHACGLRTRDTLLIRRTPWGQCSAD